MDTHHAEPVESSRTQSATVPPANGMTVNSAATVLPDVPLVTSTETVQHVKPDSSVGPTMTVAGTSVHSDTILMVIYVHQLLLTTTSMSSPSFHQKTVCKFGNPTDVPTDTSSEFTEVKKKPEMDAPRAPSRNHSSLPIEEPGSMVNTT